MSFKNYLKAGIVEIRPYVPGEDLGSTSISQFDADNGSPKEGDMIARNPAKPADQWLLAAVYFKENYVEAPAG